jgi:NaMN:DMB phosphoribosyltransferase
MLRSPEQQKEAAEAARKEGKELADKEGKTAEPVKPASVPEPMAGSKTGLQNQP